jgi:hypothetical protein
MIATLPDARQAPGFSVGQDADGVTASYYAGVHKGATSGQYLTLGTRLG